MNETHPESLASGEDIDLGEIVRAEEALEKAVVPQSAIQNVIRAMDDLKAIRTFIANELEPDRDYGAIPGTSEKNVLLLPGAQKICMYFNVRPVFRVQRTELGNGHLEVYIETDIVDRRTGAIMGSGVGSCTTMETKYRFRQMERVCPSCGKAAIFKGKKFKPTDPETWFCWKKKLGCGQVFAINDKSITDQEVGQKENENIHDTRNTCLKIGKKRSLIDATIGLGCLSELFTQDIEDFFDLETPPEKKPPAVEMTKDQIGKNILDSASEYFLQAEDYAGLLRLFKSDENAAHRAGVWNEFCDLKMKAFLALREKLSNQEPLVAVPADAQLYWLEFYALDEAYRKGNREAANKIFFECKDSMSKLGTAWKDYAAELKKAVTT